MALEGSEWGVIAGVVIAIIAVYAGNHYANLRSTGALGAGKDDGPSVNPMLSRFVVHDGSVAGEVMAVNDEELIVKHKGNYRAIPIGLAQLHDDEVHIKADADWPAWEEAGAAWHATNSAGQDNEVTEHLTTSADIKSPARKAFDARKDEEE